MSSVEVENAITRQKQFIREHILGLLRQEVCKNPKSCPFCGRGLNKKCPTQEINREYNQALRDVMVVVK